MNRIHRHRHFFFFFFQAEDGIRDLTVTGVQTCALPISLRRQGRQREPRQRSFRVGDCAAEPLLHFRLEVRGRSEEHTSELQSQSNLVCRLLLEKKKKVKTSNVVLELARYPYEPTACYTL